MPLTLAFVMDPLERVDVAVDTSFAFILEAQRRGHRVLHVAPSRLSLEHNRVHLRGNVVRVQPRQGDPIASFEPARLAATDCSAIFIRTDPPFDQAYLTATWMLSFAEEAGVCIINSPRGLREANEKLYALQFPELCPRTVVSSSRRELIAALAQLGGEAILKPIDGHGGLGVFRLRQGDSNVAAIIDLLTGEGQRPVILQEFLPLRRDKRLVFIDGKLRGAVVRVPPRDDHRGNVHVGGTVESAEITADDRAIEAAMGKRLRNDGLFFVGLDVIGNKLIEVNVTSPTLVQEIRQLGGPDLAAEVMDAVEARVAST